MNIPSRMRVIEIREPGGIDVLVLGERPVPAPTQDQVLLRVAAAGVNRADAIQRNGAYPMPPGVSADIPGLEVSGTVAQVGANVQRWRVGDTVCALIVGGGYAEFVVAPEEQCMAIPAQTTLINAAGLPETFCTVWTNMIDRACLQPGETLLIQGGSSGIGVTAIRVAKAFGAKVFVTAGSDAKCRACVALGADEAINYRDEDLVAAVMARTDGCGVDVILDLVCGPYVEREIRLLRRSGRLVFVGMMGGSIADSVDFTPVLLNRLTLTGSSLRSCSIAEKAQLCRALEARVWPLFNGGQVHTVTHAVLPLKEARQAHALLESSAHIGKILLVP
jgi:NADPH:quinone reductase